MSPPKASEVVGGQIWPVVAVNGHTSDGEDDRIKARGVEREERGKERRAVDGYHGYPLWSAAMATAATHRRAAVAATEQPAVGRGFGRG